MGRDYPAKPERKMDRNAIDTKEALQRLKEAGYLVQEIKGCEIQIMIPEKPRVFYFPMIARWREAGDPFRHYGSMIDLLSWLKERK